MGTTIRVNEQGSLFTLFSAKYSHFKKVHIHKVKY